MLLRNAKLRQLYLGTVVSEFGSQFGSVAIAFAALGIGGPPFLGVVLAARTIAAGALMLLGGHLADRLPRTGLMVSADTARAVAQVVTAAAVVAAKPWSPAVMVGAQIMYGSAEAFFTPSARGLVPRLVAKEDLATANALMGFTRNVVRPVGPALGGLLVAFLGPAWGLSIDAASFAIGGILIALISIPSVRRVQTDSAGAKEVLRTVISQHWLLAMIATSIVFQAAVLGPVLIGGPTFAQDLHSPEVWGFLLGATGLGAVLGSIGSARLAPTYPLLAMAGLILLTVPYPLSFALAARGWTLVLAGALYGASLSLIGNIYFTVLQSRIPDQFLGRVLALDEVCSIAILPLSQIAAGIIAQRLGVRVLFAGSTVAVTLAASVLLLVPAARRLDNKSEPESAEANLPQT